MSHLSTRQPFDEGHVSRAPASPGVYIIYDLAGAIYVGRSGSSIRDRLYRHLHGSGNRNIARAVRVGAATSLSFCYCVTLQSVQRDAEAYLIAELGAAQYANLRRESLPEDR